MNAAGGSAARKVCQCARCLIGWRGSGYISGRMEQSFPPIERRSPKPLSVGLTCWRWERKRTQAIVQLAQRLGVTVQLTERIRFLHRDIEARVSGPNVDRFIVEFVRHC